MKASLFCRMQTVFYLPLALASLLAGCAPNIPPPSNVEHFQIPADFPEAYYQRAKENGIKILGIDSKHSLLTIIVRRGGALALLGHDHVVASHDIRGFVDIDAGRADIYIPLAELSVDEASLRTEAKFTTQPTEGAIAGTRQNMLDKVLETEKFPFAHIHINRESTESTMLTVAISLHGTTQTFEVPLKIENLERGIKISGQMSFNQSAFGITPLSILGGALQVQDRLDLNFRIVAGTI